MKAILLTIGLALSLTGQTSHLNCVGTGHPTVMIVGAGSSSDWSRVQDGVAKFARVCTYDPGPAQSCEGRVGEIHTMLRKAGIAGPYVLVGHSIGAAFERLYAARYPAEVAGMVIGDHAGSYRMPNGAGMRRSAEGMADATSEHAFYDRCLAEAKATTAERPDPLGNKPLVVIANHYLADSEDYQKFQVGLLGLSHNSKAMVSAISGHGVPVEDPDIFVVAIRQVAVTARKILRME